MLNKLKQWLHESTAPEEPIQPKPERGRTAPFQFDLELAMIPRLPTCPEGVSIELLKQAMGDVGQVMREQGIFYGTVTYWPRQRELTIHFPEPTGGSGLGDNLV